MKVEYDFSEAKGGAVIPERGKTRITIYLGRIAIAFAIWRHCA